jgi:DNA-binding response OmpR family regulator
MNISGSSSPFATPLNPNQSPPVQTQMEEGFVFVVEDDPDLQQILTFNLSKEKYLARCFAKAEELLFFLDASPKLEPIGFVVDINLAGKMNGLELVRELRKNKRFARIPVLMLTAKGENSDVVRGLDEGADDYLAKPFDTEVFMARMKSCLRRSERTIAPISQNKKALSISGIDLDPATHKIVVLGKDTPLTTTEYGILTTLMNRPDEVMSRDDLLLRLVGPNKTITGRTIDVHIRALRSKLGKKARHIVTIRGFGYKFVP